MPSAEAQQSRLWLWILIAAGVLTQTALNLARPVISYKILALGGDAAAIGIVTALYATLPVVAALWLGRVSDRVASLRGMVVTGAVLLAVASVLLVLAPGIALIGAASAVLGLGHLVFTIAGQSAIARYAPLDKMDSGFGWFTAAYAGGQLIGPLVAGLLLGSGMETAGAQRMAAIDLSLYLSAGIALAAAPLMLAYAPGRPRHSGRAAAGAAAGKGIKNDDGGALAAKPDSVLSILRQPGVTWNMLAALALLSMLDILVAFLPLLAEEQGVAPVVVGALLAIRALATIFSRVILHRLLGRWTRYQLLVASLAGAGAVIAAAPFFLGNLWLAGASLFIGGFFLGLGQPLTMTLISQAVRPESRGAALALRLLGNRVGQVVLPLAAGLVAAPLGPAGAIWFSCAVLGVTGAARWLPGATKE
ncbi:putative drug resistance efflux protein [Arthrobacter crystallopoietes BAB-32]|uniref:Putative drug resistance efflux protein n=1 Tax=Arthrobacter crystallopoietes BAB-32 TaxID=1246476 RepID=N1UUY6_9MICC|nr:MFS transporter [Arthrobacter crystallopoietes]EMY32845.1 putative drug resistance efflux protein [Arthrobacter crystallopoietes BAB-32]